MLLEDRLYDEWLDLYQSAFPIDEQVRVSEHNRILRNKKSCRSKHQHLLAAVNERGKLIGMARYERVTRCRGVDYTQSVGWQPPVPMCVMVHPCLPDLDAAQAVEVARCVLGKRLKPDGVPSLK